MNEKRDLLYSTSELGNYRIEYNAGNSNRYVKCVYFLPPEINKSFIRYDETYLRVHILSSDQ